MMRSHFRPAPDDPFDLVSTYYGTGMVGELSGPDPDSSAPCGVLVIPDPEQRRGWRERYVYPEPKPGAPRQQLGFRKP